MKKGKGDESTERRIEGRGDRSMGIAFMTQVRP